MNNQMNEYIHCLREGALRMFPGATSVEILISNEGVSVNPHYSGERYGTSMKTIEGDWCTKREKL